MRRTAQLSALLGALFMAVVALGLAPHAAAATPQQVTVYDPDDVLSDQEEATLRDETAKLDFPVDVPHVDYIVSATATAPYDDWVKDFGLNQHRELINAEGNKWADGHVLFTVDVNLRKMGTYVGEDLKEPLGYTSDATKYVDSMQSDFKKGDWVGGLLTGAKTVADHGSSSGLSATQGALLGGGIAVLGVGAAGVAVAATRKKQRSKALADYDTVATDYARLAGELDSIDVRAHSLRSPIADAALRRQWEEIKSGFLNYHDAMMHLPEKADEKAIFARRKEFASAAGSVESLRHAEANIETMFKMENGDTDTRLRELLNLREDILKARVEAKDSAIAERIGELDARSQALMKSLDSPTLMDEYSQIVSEFGTLTQALAKKQLTKANLDKHETPSLGSADWHPGYGYNNYVPFMLMSTWHSEAVQAASASSTASYSGGFSGAGASGSF